METEEVINKLKLIGFSSFVHLDKKERDGKERLVRWTIYQNEWIGIELVKVSNLWCVEKSTGNDDFQKCFSPDNPSLEEVLNFFKFVFFKDSDISDLL